MGAEVEEEEGVGPSLEESLGERDIRWALMDVMWGKSTST